MYKKALKEVNEILENMEEKYTRQISPEFINQMIENMDWSYEFYYDTTKKLEDQKILEETKTILSILYLKYFASEEEKHRLIEQIKQNEMIEEEQKRKIYNPNDIFKKGR